MVNLIKIYFYDKFIVGENKTMYNPFLIGELKKCQTGQSVDSAFEKRKITNLETRTKYLGHCMGNPQVFFGGKEKDDNYEEFNSKYVTMRSMFITGSWR